MTVDRNVVADLIPDVNSSAILDVIEPYFPVLKRLGSQAVTRFLDGASQQDWERVNRELYAEMTEDERDVLGAAVLADARKAVKEAYESSRKWQEDLTRILLGVVLSVV